MRRRILPPILLLVPLLTIGYLPTRAGVEHLLPRPRSVTENGQQYPAADRMEIRDIATVTIVGDLPEVPPDKKQEAYLLTVTSRGIEIEATTETGVLRATQTLRQLRTGDHYEGCRIVDWPAFAVRGFMQDVGRTYISIGELKQQIAKLSEYKINVFHWHLTENQGWRLESKKFPQLNDAGNYERMPGRFYTLDEARDLVAFCHRHGVTLIPEIDMPGHSRAFEKAFGHDMQSAEGMAILKEVLNEVCETFDVPWFHIGTDEVRFTNPAFVPEMVAHVRALGKKVISWNPGWNYSAGEIDMTQLWSYRGRAQAGIPAIDSRLHYINHFDTFADLIALYNSRILDAEQGSEAIAGCIVALWNDRYIISERDIVIQNNFYPAMLALAERSWLGGGSEYFDGHGTVLPDNSDPLFRSFVDFENRLLWHKENNFAGYPFAYVRQTDVRWTITDPFPNGGDLSAVFPPEEGLSDSYTYRGREYKTRRATGAGIYLRHVWGNETVRAFYDDPQPNHTAYAWTHVWSPRRQKVGLWIAFQNYSRSETDPPPPQGKWDHKGSRVWINDREILPPVWLTFPAVESLETPLTNENFEVRDPLPITLERGWNRVFLKLPVGCFSTPETRLVKWMFNCVPVTTDGERAIEGLVYSPEVSPGGLRMAGVYGDNMVLQRDTPLTIRGMADPGAKVTVRIARQTHRTHASAVGEWSVVLNPLTAGGAPLSLEVSSSGRSLRFDNVAVGEVWLCSGQSNMAFPLSGDADFRETADALNNPSIRLFDMKPRPESGALVWDKPFLDDVDRRNYYADGGWVESDAKSAPSFSAVAWHFGKMLADSLGIPVGLIHNAVGGSPTESWIDRHELQAAFPEILKDWTQNELIQDWVRARAMQNMGKTGSLKQRHPFEPGYLFETGIAPLTAFPVRGVIWYQGESNAHNAGAHEKLFSLLVESWRKLWNAPAMPFLHVQLSSIERPDWPLFRDSQRRLTERMAAIRMVVSSDLGDSLDVHPRRKREVGRRLGRQALGNIYHRKHIVPSGPLFRSARFGEEGVYVWFDHAEGLRSADGGPIRGFEVAGADGSFRPARAEVQNGGEILRVWADGTGDPKYLRYGWQPFTRANLVNGSALPASTFKTEETMAHKVERLPDFPVTGGVSAPFAGVHNNVLIVAGGCNFPDVPASEGGVKAFYDDIFRLDLSRPDEGWQKGGKLPVAVAYGTCVTTRDGIVCMGGQSGGGTVADVVRVSFDPVSQKIVTEILPSLPGPVSDASSASVGGDIHVAGGTLSDAIYILDADDPQRGWRSVKASLGAERRQSVVFSRNGELFIAGGYDERSATAFTDVLRFDGAGKQWCKFADISIYGHPTTFVGAGCVNFSSRSVLMVGGVDHAIFSSALKRIRRREEALAKGDVHLAEDLRDEGRRYMSQSPEWYGFSTRLLSFDAESGQWSTLGDTTQSARAGAGVTIHDNHLYIICGELKPGVRTPEVNRISISSEKDETGE